MPITLSALDSRQVASATKFEVLLGEPATRLIIMSGIAVPEFWTNNDEVFSEQEILVRLGIYVAQLEPGAVTNLGLASIENDETNFLFRLDSGILEHEQPSGELVLRAQAAILGEGTRLHRFSYQIVAHVRRARAQISGVIAVPKDIRNVLDLPPPELNAAFEISANRLERSVAGGFTFDNLIPIRPGVTQAVRRSTQGMQFVEYSIMDCPFATPLIVNVKLAGNGWNGSLIAGQVAGDRPITLTGLSPDASGVDFSVSRLQPVR